MKSKEGLIEHGMQMSLNALSEAVRKATYDLKMLYPVEGQFGSLSSLWWAGLTDDVVTTEEFNTARRYYGSSWIKPMK